MSDAERAALERARARLDRIDDYPRPVRIARVRLAVCPGFFRLPWLRRFDGYATHRLILLRRPVIASEQDDLITHELCHVWQMQHHPVRMPLSYAWQGYDRNQYEQQARLAAERTRPPA